MADQTEREKIVEAMAREAVLAGEERGWGMICDGDVTIAMFGAALDAALPLILPENPARGVERNAAMATRRKELRDG